MFWVASWHEDCDAAAIVVTNAEGESRVWVNGRHVAPDQMPLVRLWARAQAAHRPPVGMLWSADLIALAGLRELGAG